MPKLKPETITPTDDDIPELTEADFARAKPMREVMLEIVEAMKRAPMRTDATASQVEK